MSILLPIMLSLATDAAITVPLTTYGQLREAGVEIAMVQPVPRAKSSSRSGGNSSRSRRMSRPMGAPRSTPKAHFLCEKCGKEFEYAPERSGRGPTRNMGPRRGMQKPDCPHCGAKESGDTMVECPNCKKYYVSEIMKAGPGAMRGRPRGEDAPKDICPHCKTDRMEWYKQNRQRRR